MDEPSLTKVDSYGRLLGNSSARLKSPRVVSRRLFQNLQNNIPISAENRCTPALRSVCT